MDKSAYRLIGIAVLGVCAVWIDVLYANVAQTDFAVAQFVPTSTLFQIRVAGNVLIAALLIGCVLIVSKASVPIWEAVLYLVLGGMALLLITVEGYYFATQVAANSVTTPLRLLVTAKTGLTSHVGAVLLCLGIYQISKRGRRK